VFLCLNPFAWVALTPRGHKMVTLATRASGAGVDSPWQALSDSRDRLTEF
jgi:hypothetical protein